jgi:hypothetical protein
VSGAESGGFESSRRNFRTPHFFDNTVCDRSLVCRELKRFAWSVVGWYRITAQMGQYDREPMEIRDRAKFTLLFYQVAQMLRIFHQFRLRRESIFCGNKFSDVCFTASETKLTNLAIMSCAL